MGVSLPVKVVIFREGSEGLTLEIAMRGLDVRFRWRLPPYRAGELGTRERPGWVAPQGSSREHGYCALLRQAASRFDFLISHRLRRRNAGEADVMLRGVIVRRHQSSVRHILRAPPPATLPGKRRRRAGLRGA